MIRDKPATRHPLGAPNSASIPPTRLLDLGIWTFVGHWALVILPRTAFSLPPIFPALLTSPIPTKTSSSTALSSSNASNGRPSRPSWSKYFRRRFGVVRGSKGGDSMSVWGDLREVSGSVLCRFRVGFFDRPSTMKNTQTSASQTLERSTNVFGRSKHNFCAQNSHQKPKHPCQTHSPWSLGVGALLAIGPWSFTPLCATAPWRENFSSSSPVECPKMSRNVPFQTTRFSFMLPDRVPDKQERAYDARAGDGSPSVVKFRPCGLDGRK